MAHAGMSSDRIVGMDQGGGTQHPLDTGRDELIMRHSWAERRQALAELLRERRLDALLAYAGGGQRTSPFHRWLTGVSCTTEDGLTMLLTREGEMSFVDVPWGADALRTHLARHGIEASIRTGASEDEVRTVSRELSRRFPRIGFAGVLPLSMCEGDTQRYEQLSELDQLMMGKNEVELRRLARVAIETGQILTETLARVEVGMSEDELIRSIAQQVVDRGVTLGLEPVRIISGPALEATTGRPRVGHRIRTGDALCLDLALLTPEGLFSDITRMGFMGAHPAEEAYHTLSATVERIAAECRAGMPVGALAAWAQQACHEAGLPAATLNISELGHGIGYRLHERPGLALPADLDTPLVEGSVICLEPEIRTRHSMIRVEEEVLIGRHGGLMLSRQRSARGQRSPTSDRADHGVCGCCLSPRAG